VIEELDRLLGASASLAWAGWKSLAFTVERPSCLEHNGLKNYS
jgi:hypothetical protein